MTVECELCGDRVWCLRYENEWICRRCFIDTGMGDYSEWKALNDEVKRQRRMKQMMEFDDNYVNI